VLTASAAARAQESSTPRRDITLNGAGQTETEEPSLGERKEGDEVKDAGAGPNQAEPEQRQSKEKE
jgi:hypothetical protein